mmetsp:Transcript_24959/g.41400  ORF Transcript_24959/g.41400 Transcript_24959/m.41400 type:complete len:268 (-) Transcript_24959:85-888(-)
MKESRIKLAHLTGRGRDGHGVLSTTNQNMILRFRNDSVIDRTVRLIGFEMLQVDGIKEFGGIVRGGSDEQRLLAIERDSINLLFVSHDFFFFIACLWIIQTNGTIVKGDEDVFIEWHPNHIGGIDALAGGMVLGQINFETRVFVVDIVNGNFGIVFDEWIGNGGKLFGPICPGDATDRTAVRKGAKAFAGLTGPEFGRGVRGSGQEMGGETIAIQVPDRSLVTVKSTEAFAIFSSPYGWNVIFGGRKEQIAVVIVLDARNRTFVALE